MNLGKAPTVRLTRNLVILSAVLLALAAMFDPAAADSPKKKVPTPGWDDPTVGVLGAHRGSSDSGAPPTRHAVPATPPAPIAAPAVPTVEAEPATVPSLPAAPRPGVETQGSSVGASTAPATFTPAATPNVYLVNHPFVSGLIAGLVGTDLGAQLYGGPMSGDQDAVVVGYAARIGFILLCLLLGLRSILHRLDRREAQDLAPLSGRREPSFEPKGRADGDGRREPTLRHEA